VTASIRIVRAKVAVLPLAFSSLIVSPAALAQAVPKVGTCPSGYRSSGGACIPSSRERGAHPALAKIGTCPSGYHTSGDYCLASSDRAKHAILKTGTCPSGYSSSGAYCLSYR
jgi:hypothetical protein